MKSTKATIAMAAAMLLASVPVMQAQRTSPHELSVNFQGLGFGSMPFHGDETWSDHPGLSLGFSVGYTYWFNEHVGFRTGLRMNRLSHNQEIKNLDMPFSQQLTATSLGLPGGSALTTVDFVARAASVQEEWQYTFVELPLQLALEYSNVYFNVGLSLSKAVQATGNYSYDNPSCDIVGLPDYGIDMSATPVPVALSGETERDIKNRDMEKPFYLLLDAEVGYNFPVGECTSVGVGLFARYAPVRHKTDNDGAAYTVNATTPPNFNVAQPSKTAMADKAGYYEVGLSLGVNFGFCKSHKDAVEPSYVLAPRDEKSEAELAALKAAREKAENELAAMKAAREKAEAEMAAMKAEREKAEAERLAAEKAANDKAAAERLAAEKAARDKANADRMAAEKAAREQAARQQNAQQAKAEAQKKLEAIGATVYFKSSGTKAQFDEKTDDAIHAICDAMKADQNLKVTVYGHTDNTGSLKANMKYGKQRAQALKDYMVKLGAPAKNITCESKGPKEPVADNTTKEGRAKNRRATVELK